MTIWEFDIVLAGGDFDDDHAEAIGAAGCTDCTPVTRGGVTRLRFARNAESLQAAIRSAIRNVQSAGNTVARVELDPTTEALKI